MPFWLVSYDLLVPGRNYEGLFQALRQMSATRVMLSQWALRSNLSAMDILNRLIPHIDSNDRMIVSPLSSSAYIRTIVELNTL